MGPIYAMPNEAVGSFNRGLLFSSKSEENVKNREKCICKNCCCKKAKVKNKIKTK